MGAAEIFFPLFHSQRTHEKNFLLQSTMESRIRRHDIQVWCDMDTTSWRIILERWVPVEKFHLQELEPLTNEQKLIYDYLNFIKLIPIYISHFWIFCNDYNKQQ